MLQLSQLTLDDKIRFWSKAIRLGPEDCWNWIGGCTGNEERYKRPVFSIKGTAYIAARVAWVIEHGQDPGDLLVCHKCQPPTPSSRQLCVNPNHLWLGTHAENMADAIEKNGNPKNRSRLTEQDVRKIRQLRESGIGPTRIGEMYNLTREAIQMIVRRQSFPEIV
jgi:hypothetical protein